MRTLQAAENAYEQEDDEGDAQNGANIETIETVDDAATGKGTALATRSASGYVEDDTNYDNEGLVLNIEGDTESDNQKTHAYVDVFGDNGPEAQQHSAATTTTATTTATTNDDDAAASAEGDTAVGDSAISNIRQDNSENHSNNSNEKQIPANKDNDDVGDDDDADVDVDGNGNADDDAEQNDNDDVKDDSSGHGGEFDSALGSSIKVSVCVSEYVCVYEDYSHLRIFSCRRTTESLKRTYFRLVRLCLVSLSLSVSLSLCVCLSVSVSLSLSLSLSLTHSLSLSCACVYVSAKVFSYLCLTLVYFCHAGKSRIRCQRGASGKRHYR